MKLQRDWVPPRHNGLCARQNKESIYLSSLTRWALCLSTCNCTWSIRTRYCITCVSCYAHIGCVLQMDDWERSKNQWNYNGSECRLDITAHVPVETRSRYIYQRSQGEHRAYWHATVPVLFRAIAHLSSDPVIHMFGCVSQLDDWVCNKQQHTTPGLSAAQT
jgi:hypothetical protein